MNIEIQTQHVAMHPEWRALIDQRLARLAERYPRLIRIHVTLRHGRHHLGGVEEVDVVASYPGATLLATKQKEEVRDAVHAAFDALERELGSHRERQRSFRVSPVGERPTT